MFQNSLFAAAHGASATLESFRVEAIYTIDSESYREIYEVDANDDLAARLKVTTAIMKMFKNARSINTEVVAL